ncbi:MAG TPA: hypothetical protein VNL91_11300 [Thermoanaerobaculia bacterium]|nr:hypothetical protein [Thermoanaerobaculia bacterium]
MLERLTIDDFRPLCGSTFRVLDPAVEIVLDRAVAVMESQRGRLSRQPFSLFFRGPSSPFLPQATYQMRHSAFGDVLTIFIVPVGRSGDAFEYEAVFT